MALKFQGDRAVGVLNDPKNTFNTNDLFRVYDGGILVAGGVSVDHGDFVSWDGTKWVREADIKIARSDEITNTNSSIAPDYTKKTYEANSYVMYGGVLYTNPNAIETAEDWNPAHWTQTTITEMMAGAGGGYEDVTLAPIIEAPYNVPVGNREIVTVSYIGASNTDEIQLQLADDCTDAVVFFSNKRPKDIAFDKLKITRQDLNDIPLFGKNYIFDVGLDVDYAQSALVSTLDGGSQFEVPTDWSEVATSQYAHQVDPSVEPATLSTDTGFLIEIKGNVAILHIH